MLCTRFVLLVISGTQNGGDYGRRPGRSSLREGGDTLATSPPMEEPFDVTLVSQVRANFMSQHARRVGSVAAGASYLAVLNA